ncbi:VOC family protein [Streptomyces cinnamoneus]|uniref:Hydroxylase n=1 Tax=Streptomyces cinnamoneus TaxID=53446 RepID=A0A918WJL3_STRCJ|nr:VOC family protein [Streptomyces cinnamoneus]GHC48876.1 hydroxylase [Streptomyces cinnamoneus]
MLTTDFVAGSPCWLDLGSPNVEGAVDFYSDVFGWDHQSAGPEAGGYGVFRKDGRDVAALGPLTEEGASSAWTVYFRTLDADATAKAAEQGGATVRVAPFDVTDAGRMACLTDPCGAEFAVWQPGTVKGLQTVTEPGSLCWTELHTSDPTAAKAFYRGIFGWRSEDVKVPGMTYTVLSTAAGEDQQRASFGGVVPFREPADKPHWLPYFEVPDVDQVVALTEGNGGSVIMPAADAPDIGRMAWLADPYGAAFAVIKSVTPPAEPAPSAG